MPDFSQNISRIERLTHQVTLDVEAESYRGAKEHLDKIIAYATAAQMQLKQFRLTKTRSKHVDGDSDS